MKKLLFLLPFFLLAIFSYAQQKIVSGTVTAKSDKTPLAGVTVQAKNKTVTTDSKGNFSIQTSEQENLTFTYVGMTTIVLSVSNILKGTLIEMEIAENNLDAIVITGYKSERKKDITGAVSVVNINETTKESNANILTSLQGRVPGVVINNDGSPGGTGFNVTIRGFSSTRGGGPLYVIDGVGTTNPAALTPNDIESIQVLKDAASATIYGARANNGVIIITTKNGKSPKTQIKFSSYFGQQKLAQLP